MNIVPTLSIYPAITEIIGSLFADGHKNYDLYQLKSEELVNVYFVKIGDEIKICNDSHIPIKLSFPYKDWVQGISHVISAKSNMIITKDLVNHAKVYSNRMEIAVNGSNYLHYTQDNSYLVFSASGKVSKDIDGDLDISKDINIEILDDDLFITVSDSYILEGIALLTISGNCNEPSQRYQNIMNKNLNGLTKSNEMHLPGILIPYRSSNDLNMDIGCYITLK